VDRVLLTTLARTRATATLAVMLGIAFLSVAPSTAAASGSLTWSSPMLVDQLPDEGAPIPLTSISCPSASLCVAADEVGNVLTATAGRPGVLRWQSAPVDTGGLISSVSCQSMSLCFAVDNHGNFLWSQDPTGGVAAWHSSDIDGTNELLSVACPSLSLCVASDHQLNVLSSVDPFDASPWQSISFAGDTPDPQYNSVVSLWCQSSSLCVAAQAGAGSIWSATQPTGATAAWQLAPNVMFGLTSMSCNEQGLCLAASDGGQLASSVSPAGGLSAWHVVGPALGPVTAVACTLPSFCVAADNTGAIATSNDPTGGISSWERATVDSNALTAISCASQSFCVAVDGAGRALIGQPPKCVVPNVVGDPLGAARHAIRAARCAVGRVNTPHKPKRKLPEHRKWKLVVGHETPRTGSVEPARTRVFLTLVYKAARN
jgi:hypothetical protein